MGNEYHFQAKNKHKVGERNRLHGANLTVITLFVCIPSLAWLNSVS
jgi:hypothetical protein